MFWLLVILFWFSLLFGTHFVGNGLGNLIAVIALVGWLRSRRRKSTAMSTDSNAPVAQAPVNPNVTQGRPRATTTATPVHGSPPTLKRRWR